MIRRILLGLAGGLIAGTALAQAPEPASAPAAAPGAAIEINAERTREELRELLGRHPSQVGQVIGMSPTLLGNEPFMASYPALQAFVAEHPEVVSNPGYFFEGYQGWSTDTRPATLRFWEDFLSGLAAVLACVTGLLVLVWLVKTVLEQRRWRHLARVQAEVHQKVLDRMATNEQLLAYLDTPAGRRLLESAPIPLEGPRPVSAPVGRVLWSMQAGVVMTAAGLGLLFVSRQLPLDADLPIRVVGVGILSIGIGFVVSALASFALSRRLGLWPQQALKDS